MVGPAVSGRRIERVGAREGYDRWASTYDTTDNPVVGMDQRHAVAALRPRAGERVLDAGCGTGRHLPALLAAGCRVTGADFSDGMLRVALARAPGVPLLRADLQRGLPLGAGVFDAVLCALVGEHLTALETCFSEVRRVLVPGGRLLFTVYAPELAAAGKEANFEVEGIEYRLGAERHRREDYERAMAAAGFADLRSAAFDGDEALAREVPSARKFVGRPLLLIIEAR
jgi:SAM-dependent methyltransferase